jgi:hypothetical protein
VNHTKVPKEGEIELMWEWTISEGEGWSGQPRSLKYRLHFRGAEGSSELSDGECQTIHPRGSTTKGSVVGGTGSDAEAP